jgi:hypothetical protein
VHVSRESQQKYSLHRSTGRAYVRVGGKMVYLGKYGSPESFDAYRRIVGAAADGADRPKAESVASPEPPPKSCGLTINELILRYITEHVDGYYVKDGAPTDEPTNIRNALKTVRKLFGLSPAAELLEYSIPQRRLDSR